MAGTCTCQRGRGAVQCRTLLSMADLVVHTLLFFTLAIVVGPSPAASSAGISSQHSARAGRLVLRLASQHQQSLLCAAAASRCRSQHCGLAAWLAVQMRPARSGGCCTSSYPTGHHSSWLRRQVERLAALLVIVSNRSKQGAHYCTVHRGMMLYLIIW